MSLSLTPDSSDRCCCNIAIFAGIYSLGPSTFVGAAVITYQAYTATIDKVILTVKEFQHARAEDREQRQELAAEIKAFDKQIDYRIDMIKQFAIQGIPVVGPLAWFITHAK